MIIMIPGIFITEFLWFLRFVHIWCSCSSIHMMMMCWRWKWCVFLEMVRFRSENLILYVLKVSHEKFPFGFCWICALSWSWCNWSIYSRWLCTLCCCGWRVQKVFLLLFLVGSFRSSLRHKDGCFRKIIADLLGWCPRCLETIRNLLSSLLHTHW